MFETKFEVAAREAEEAFFEEFGETEPYLPREHRRLISESDFHPVERY